MKSFQTYQAVTAVGSEGDPRLRIIPSHLNHQSEKRLKVQLSHLHHVPEERHKLQMMISNPKGQFGTPKSTSLPRNLMHPSSKQHPRLQMQRSKQMQI
jgi:hypothetical protein